MPRGTASSLWPEAAHFFLQDKASADLGASLKEGLSKQAMRNRKVLALFVSEGPNMLPHTAANLRSNAMVSADLARISNFRAISILRKGSN
jgi:hypothetical protein